MCRSLGFAGPFLFVPPKFSSMGYIFLSYSSFVDYYNEYYVFPFFHFFHAFSFL